MTVNDILQQVKALSPQERDELVTRLLAMQQEAPSRVEDEDADWSEDELAELLQIRPMTGAEIVAAGLTGGWADLDIPDGATWVEEQRRKRRERHQW